MKSLAFATIRELQEQLATRKISHEELLNYYLDRFARYDNEIKAALNVFDRKSIIELWRSNGMLNGIPGILKDNISQKERPLQCASKILQNFTAMYDATVTQSLKKEGALLIGTANMDEFAMGSSTETSAYAKTRNPWDMSRVPGGSSGGSAAAVAAGLVPWALGSDTGGSVRQPAAFCGVVGMKPTYGLVSRYGLVAYASSLDQIGPITRDVYGNAKVLSVIAGHDIKDSSSLFVEKKDYTRNLDGTLAPGLRIGIIDNALGAQGMDSDVVSAVENATQELEKLGAKITHIQLPTLQYAAAAYFIVSRAEAASNLARFDGVRYGLRAPGVESLKQLYFETRGQGFGDEVKSRIMVGNYVLSTGHAGQFYDNAKKIQYLIRREFLQAFNSVDLLIMPTQPAPAFKFGAFDVDKLQMDLQDYFTCPVNLAGIPAISLPCGFSKDNLPIGFQIIGPHLSEGLMYQTAYAYEQRTDWHKRYPEQFAD